jgi:uracil-DNA glycosylase
MVNVNIEESWKSILSAEFNEPYFEKLAEFVKQAYKEQKVYPPAKYIFRAFEMCTLDLTKVVILGQDPYHGYRQANGLAFSVNDGVSLPPSLKNIFKEIQDDIGRPVPENGNLDRWARQGVLLLNATLTVQDGTPGAHQNRGWEKFTNSVIHLISVNKENVVFILWGSYARSKADLIDTNKHLILQSAHPSPFSANKGFFGNRHFSKANEYLVNNNKAPIEW